MATTAPTRDDRGVPLDATSARHLSRERIEQTIVAVVADLEAESVEDVQGWPRETDGTVALDSQLALDVLNELTGHLGKMPLDLAAIPHERWTSVGGLVAVVHDVYAALPEEP